MAYSHKKVPRSGHKLKVGDLEAWIEVGGEPAQVYQVKEEPFRISCYIASTEGANFSVCWRNLEVNAKSRKLGLIFVDGAHVESPIFAEHYTGVQQRTGYRISPTLIRDFVFAPLVTTDNEANGVNDPNLLHELGSIRMNIDQVEIVQYAKPWVPLQDPISTLAPVHEKAKKGQGHRTTLGNARPITEATYSETRSLGLAKQDFVFRYGPIEWLKARGIVPPAASSPAQTRPRPSVLPASSFSSPSPAAIQVTGLFNSDKAGLDMNLLDDDDLVALQRIKEKQALKKTQPRKVDPIVVPRMLLAEGAFIDLTGDDD